MDHYGFAVLCRTQFETGGVEPRSCVHGMASLCYVVMESYSFSQ